MNKRLWDTPSIRLSVGEDETTERKDYYFLAEWIPSRFKGDSRVRRLLIVLAVLGGMLVAGAALGQDSNVASLPAEADPTSDDLLYVVNDPGGTPGDRKLTFENLWRSTGQRAFTQTTHGFSAGQWIQFDVVSDAWELLDTDVADDSYAVAFVTGSIDANTFSSFMIFKHWEPVQF